MPSKSINIDEGSKRLLEELQAILQLGTGAWYSLQDILAASIRLAYRRRGDSLTSSRGAGSPWKERISRGS